MTESGKQAFDDLDPLPAEAELTELEPLEELEALEPLDELEPLELLEPLEELEELEPLPAEPVPAPVAKPKPVQKPRQATPKPAPVVAKPKVAAPKSPAPKSPDVAFGAGASANASASAKTKTDHKAFSESEDPVAAKPAEADKQAWPESKEPGGSGESPDKVGTKADGKPRKSQEDRDREKADRVAAKKRELDARLGKIEGKRELEAAPLMLRKASLILLAGALLPFGGVATVGAFVGKLALLAAAFVFHQGHVHKAGEKAAGFVAGLTKNGMMPLFAVAGLLAIAGFAMPSLIGNGDYPISAGGEMVALALACFTYTHIFDYEHGGKFNPLYPMMFLGPAIMGLLGIVKLGESEGLTMVGAGLGALCVAIAGFMAVYTMYVAIKQAKVEGDLKKQAATEARKSAREARRQEKS